MTDVVNIGSAPNAHDGEVLRDAFDDINDALAFCAGMAPFDVAGLNALTLNTATIPERPAHGDLIGTLSGMTGGSTIRLYDVNEHRFQLNGDDLEAGPQLLEKGDVDVEIEELISDGTTSISRVTTLTIAVTQDNGITQPTVTLWVAPTALGTGTGASAANAKSAASVFPPVTEGAYPLTPGTVVGFLADQGDYEVEEGHAWALRSSGSSGSPIRLVGVDSSGRMKQATFTSDPPRTAYRRTSHDPEQRIGINVSSGNMAQGSVIFEAEAAVSYVNFESLFFEDCGTPFRVDTGASLNHCQWLDVGFQNLQRFLEHTATTASITHCLFERMSGFGFSKQCFRQRGDSAFNTFNYVYLDSERQDGDNFSVGIQIDENAHDITCNHCTIINLHCEFKEDNYWNSDCISAEELNYNIFLNDCYFGGATDGGIDLKSIQSIATDCTFASSKRLVKHWRSIELIRPTFIMPYRRGGTGVACIFDSVSAASSGPTATYPRLYVEDADLRLSAMDAPVDAKTAGLDNIPAGISLLYDFVRVVEDVTPLFNTSTESLRYRRSASRPGPGDWAMTGSTTFNIGADTLSLIRPITSAPDGVYFSQLTGADAALFAIPDVYGDKIVSTPIPFDGGGANTYHITARAVALGGDYKDVALTINVVDPLTLYLSGLSDAGVTLAPSVETAITNFFNTVTASSEFAAIDRLWIEGQTEIQCLMDARNPLVSLVKHGTLTFTPGIGYRGDGSTGYLTDDRGWTYTGSKFSETSAMIAMWQNYDSAPAVAGIHRLLGGTGTGANIVVNSNISGQGQTGSLMCTGLSFNNPEPTRLGFHGAVRDTLPGFGTGEWVKLFRGASKVVDQQLPIQVPKFVPALLRANTTFNSTDSIGIFALGSAVSDAYMGTLNTAFAALASALGW